MEQYKTTVTVDDVVESMFPGWKDGWIVFPDWIIKLINEKK